MDTIADEVDKIIAEAGGLDEEASNAASPDEEPEPEPTKKRAKRRSSRRKSSASKAKTLDELDVEALLPDGKLPEPEENVKTLGDLYAKFDVGNNPEFRVQIYRTRPTVWQGKSISGLLDIWDEPVLEERIHLEYGGGTYRATVIGPNPKAPSLPKHYGSHQVRLSGDPKMDRLPRALQDQNKDGAQNQPPAPMMMPHQESPKLAEAALKMFQSAADAEREERRRMERKMDERAQAAKTMFEPLAEAERRRADDLIKSEREKSEAERRYLSERAEESRREQEELRRKMERMEHSRPSIGAELRELAAAGLFKNDDGGVAREMFQNVLEKHRGEMTAVQQQHTEFIRSLREGHESEKAALRSAAEREINAEREASRSREARMEERLTNERDERRRDQDRFRQQMEERDRNWRDRMDAAKELIESTWRARHQTEVSTLQTRIEWLQGEIDRLRSELNTEKAKHEDRGDVLTQLGKYRQLKDMLGDLSDKPATQSGSGGGIGMSGSGQGWPEMLAEGLSERAPEIFEKIFGGGQPVPGQQQPGQQPQFQEGQQVQTPQGIMVVVRDPNDGQLRFAPKEALDRYNAHMAKQAQQGGGLLSEGQKRQPMPDMDDGERRRRRRSKNISAVPNFAEGLPKRRPPWEGGGDEETEGHGAPPPPPEPPPQPRMTTRSSPAAEEKHVELNAMERQVLRQIAEEVEHSVLQADEPDEFVQTMLAKYPLNVLQQIVGGYSDRQIAQGIRQLFPRSAGATPGGQDFVLQAFRSLRGAVSA